MSTTSAVASLSSVRNYWVGSDLRQKLVLANRLLVDHGILQPHSSISMRHRDKTEHYLMSRSLAPELVKYEDIVEYSILRRYNTLKLDHLH